jgi:hypothetical protein
MFTESRSGLMDPEIIDLEGVSVGNGEAVDQGSHW